MSSSLEPLRPGPRRPHRVVVLCSSGPLERHTCATLLRRAVQVVGIVVCNRPRATMLRSWIARHGVLKTGGQVLGRIYDRTLNQRRDRKVLETMVDDHANRELVRRSGTSVVTTRSYSLPATREVIRRLDPDLLLVHTKYIVGSQVRALARVGTIGGHPGITPRYRGSHSPFWALLRREPHLVGSTVFLLDDGIDTGPIVFQERTPISGGDDSHLTLAWKGMIRLAELQARAIQRLDAGEALPLKRIGQVPPDSYFGPPTLLDVIRYRRVSHGVR